LRRLACILILGLVTCGPREPAYRAIEPGTTVLELGTDERHRFEIALAADRVLSITLVQHGVDAMLDLIEPDGNRLTIDSVTDWFGRETLFLITRTAGPHKLVIRNFGQRDGRVTLTLHEPAEPRPEERARANAWRSFWEAVEDGTPLRIFSWTVCAPMRQYQVSILIHLVLAQDNLADPRCEGVVEAVTDAVAKIQIDHEAFLEQVLPRL